MCLRRIIAKIEVPCPNCRILIPRGNLAAHKESFCTKQGAVCASKLACDNLKELKEVTQNGKIPTDSAISLTEALLVSEKPSTEEKEVKGKIN